MFIKIDLPRFDVRIPSLNKVIVCRPFTTKENKHLLMTSANERPEPKDVFNVMKQIIENCVVEWNGLSFKDLAAFDLDLIYLKVRAKSKGESIKLQYNGIKDTECPECKKLKNVEVDIDKLDIIVPADKHDVVKLTNGYTLQLDYPKASSYSKLTPKGTTESDVINYTFDLARECIVKVYNDTDVFLAKDLTKKDMDEFVDCLTDADWDLLAPFFEGIPSLEHKITLDCKTCGRKDEVVLKGIQDFF